MPGRVRELDHRVEVVLFGAILSTAALLLSLDAGSLSFTWDEASDMDIVACVSRWHDPFRCLDDISQTRLPFYLHAIVASITPSARAHYALSGTFGLANLVVVYAFARDRYGVGTALVAMGLTATAPSVLGSGRMLLSHSNVIFTTFSVVCVVAYERFDRRRDVRFFWVSAVAFGLALASSVLGLFNALFIVGFWLFGSRRPRPWQAVAYGLTAAAVFLATTVIYWRPSHFGALVDASRPDGYPFPQWNYLELGTSVAPRWYSPLLFAVRIGPWWALLFAVAPLVLFRRRHDRDRCRGLLVVWAGTAGYLLLKSVLFRYDAPHQQAPWYPLVFVFVAAVVVRLGREAGRARPLVMVGFLALGALQLYDTARFFPNYLFYGAQYGQRFIGEFYGPAVLHKQGRGRIDAEIEALVTRHPEARILVADNNGFEVAGPSFVPFSRRDPSARYEFALADRLHATHLPYPEQDDYNAHLAGRYRVYRSLDYSLGEWAYRIYRLADDDGP